MISSWMLYAICASLVLSVAALAAERLLLLRGLPTRWVWLLALGGSLLVPALALVVPQPETAGALVTGSVGEPVVVAGPAPPAARATGLAQRLDAALGLGWVLLSLALLAALAASSALLRRRRRAWGRSTLAGTPVRVSGNVGPAVVGFVRPEIVVPEWILGWPEESQRLLLAHEREHLWAGDPRRLLAAIAVLILMPWNLPVWWQARRLRLAMEVDCDARVLRHRPNARAYGLLLLEVGRRVTGTRLVTAAFTESRSSLEHRIRVMTGRRRATRALLAALLALCALAPVALYALPAPDRPDLLGLRRAGQTAARAPRSAPPPLPPAPPADTIPDPSRPSYSPYEVKPELRNRRELPELLERAYPPTLRDAGIGGTAVLWVYIDETGAVKNTQVKTGSGYAQLDRAAQEVMRKASFSPARHQGRVVPVWIQLPVAFKPRPTAPDTAYRRPPGDTAYGRRGEAPTDTAALRRVPVWTTMPSDTSPAASSPRFTPFDRKPEIRNRGELVGLLETHYPETLKAAGIGGTVTMWVFIDESGTVRNTRVINGSGHQQLDQAAQAVMRAVLFTPAARDGQPVPIWIQLPVTFQTRTSPTGQPRG